MLRSSTLILLLGATACTAGVDPGAVPVSGSGGSAPTITPPSAGSGGVGVGHPGGSGGTPGSGATAGTAAYSDVPCDVGTILKNSCSMCHGQTPSFGAPMSLVRAADFANISRDGTRTVGKAVIARVSDPAHMMPPPPTPQLTPAEISTLGNWIQGGAKATACASAGTAPGGDSSTPDISDPTDPDVTCYNVTARNGSKGKFSVPTTPDTYHCFNYAPPWGTKKVHLVSWRPIIDNKQVIHHWILYNESTAVTDGADSDCSGAHPGAQMTAGWAPGGQGSNLPADVGQDVAGSGFTLETHYNNVGSAPVPDGSGVRVCVTEKLRKHEAGIHWLGTELIFLPSGGDAVGLCQPTMTEPVTILSSTPHMHLAGRHLKTTITRANGTQETLIDKPFDFQTQVGYPTPATVMPGDVLTTVCSYGASAVYGEGTKQEMCYNFVLAYPNGGLSSGLGALRRNGCTGL